MTALSITLLPRRVNEAGKPVAVICHATCALLEARLSDGRLHKKIQPFWIEDEARKLENTNFIVHGRFEPHAVRDGDLITGQQQSSGTEAARLVIEALGT